MISLFAVPKPFKGRVGAIQRNAIKNWTRLRPGPEILLFGDEEGTAKIAQELGLRHIPTAACNEYGTPLLNDLFEKAQAMATYHIVCYINADILLLGDFMKAVQEVASWRDRFLMIGQGWDVDLDHPQRFESQDSEVDLQALFMQQDQLRPPRAIDYFVFSRGLYTIIPPFATGRLWWDNWLVWNARSSRVPVVDASAVVFAVHQNHDYSHHPQGRAGVVGGEEAKLNHELAGRRHFCTIEDATHKITTKGIEWNFRHWLAPSKRAVQSWWWALLRITGPVRHPIGLRQKNIASFLARTRLIKSRRQT